MCTCCKDAGVLECSELEEEGNPTSTTTHHCKLCVATVVTVVFMVLMAMEARVEANKTLVGIVCFAYCLIIIMYYMYWINYLLSSFYLTPIYFESKRLLQRYDTAYKLCDTILNTMVKVRIFVVFMYDGRIVADSG